MKFVHKLILFLVILGSSFDGHAAPISVQSDDVDSEEKLNVKNEDLMYSQVHQL